MVPDANRHNLAQSNANDRLAKSRESKTKPEPTKMRKQRGEISEQKT